MPTFKYYSGRSQQKKQTIKAQGITKEVFTETLRKYKEISTKIWVHFLKVELSKTLGKYKEKFIKTQENTENIHRSTELCFGILDTEITDETLLQVMLHLKLLKICQV